MRTAIFGLVTSNFSQSNDEKNIIVHERDNNCSLCGFPGVCLAEAFEECKNISLYECPSCGLTRSVVFAVIIGFLGVLILLGNFLVVYSLCYGEKKQKNKLGYTKVSLAIADMMNGFQIIFVTIPNFIWTMKANSLEISKAQLFFRSSVQAIAGGFFFVIIYSSSLYHLLLISVQRFIAIKWPIAYRLSGNKTTFVAIGFIWLLSALVATIPAWFPRSFVFTYVVNAFLFAPAFISSYELQMAEKIALCLFFGIPYFLMSAFTFLSGVLVCKRLKSSSRKLSSKSQKIISLHQQFDIVKTLAFMEIGFTATLLPSAIIALLYYYEVLDCDTISTPFLITFYVSTSNSLVNVIVYSWRDEEIRCSLKHVLEQLRCKAVSKLLPQKQVRVKEVVMEQAESTSNPVVFAKSTVSENNWL